MTSSPTGDDDLRDLVLLDALGETSPRQKARLVTELQANRALAIEHADLVKLIDTLAMPTPAIPAMPAQLVSTLPKFASLPACATWGTLRFSLAAAAAVALMAAGWWMLQAPKDSTSATPSVAQVDAPETGGESLPMGASKPAQSLGPGATRRALLIAVEPWPDKEKDPERGAGWRDLQMMREILTQKWGFAEANIHEVFNKDATTKNVLAAFEQHLIDTTQPGDSVVIYWTSHGTQVADLNGDEPDSLDEAYCTFDFDWSKPDSWFTDDLFGALLDRIPTREILVITDACHAGGSTRGGEEQGDALPKAISSGFIPSKVPLATSAEEKTPSHVMHLAACAPDEISYGRSGTGGHFTIQLHSIFMVADPVSLSFQQAVERVRPKIDSLFKAFTLEPGNPKTWTPQFEGPVTKKIATFLDPPAVSPAPPSPPSPPTPPPPPLPVWQKQSGDIVLDLATDQTIYTEGDRMQVTVTPDLDCHLRLYYLSADHAVHQIFPNQFQPDGFVKKGETVTLPGAGANFEFTMSAPFGNEILMAVASSVAFTDQAGQDLQTQLFQEFKDTDLESLAHRGIDVTGKEVLTGRALHLYRVEAKK